MAHKKTTNPITLDPGHFIGQSVFGSTVVTHPDLSEQRKKNKHIESNKPPNPVHQNKKKRTYDQMNNNTNIETVTNTNSNNKIQQPLSKRQRVVDNMNATSVVKNNSNHNIQTDNENTNSNNNIFINPSLMQRNDRTPKRIGTKQSFINHLKLQKEKSKHTFVKKQIEQLITKLQNYNIKSDEEFIKTLNEKSFNEEIRVCINKWINMYQSKSQNNTNNIDNRQANNILDISPDTQFISNRVSNNNKIKRKKRLKSKQSNVMSEDSSTEYSSSDDDDDFPISTNTNSNTSTKPRQPEPSPLSANNYPVALNPANKPLQRKKRRNTPNFKRQASMEMKLSWGCKLSQGIGCTLNLTTSPVGRSCTDCRRDAGNIFQYYFCKRHDVIMCFKCKQEQQKEHKKSEHNNTLSVQNDGEYKPVSEIDRRRRHKHRHRNESSRHNRHNMDRDTIRDSNINVTIHINPISTGNTVISSYTHQSAPGPNIMSMLNIQNTQNERHEQIRPQSQSQRIKNKNNSKRRKRNNITFVDPTSLNTNTTTIESDDDNATALLNEIIGNNQNNNNNQNKNKNKNNGNKIDISDSTLNSQHSQHSNDSNHLMIQRNNNSNKDNETDNDYKIQQPFLQQQNNNVNTNNSENTNNNKISTDCSLEKEKSNRIGIKQSLINHLKLKKQKSKSEFVKVEIDWVIEQIQNWNIESDEKFIKSLNNNYLNANAWIDKEIQDYINEWINIYKSEFKLQNSANNSAHAALTRLEREIKNNPIWEYSKNFDFDPNVMLELPQFARNDALPTEYQNEVNKYLLMYQRQLKERNQIQQRLQQSQHQSSDDTNANNVNNVNTQTKCNGKEENDDDVVMDENNTPEPIVIKTEASPPPPIVTQEDDNKQNILEIKKENSNNDIAIENTDDRIELNDNININLNENEENMSDTIESTQNNNDIVMDDNNNNDYDVSTIAANNNNDNINENNENICDKIECAKDNNDSVMKNNHNHNANNTNKNKNKIEKEWICEICNIKYKNGMAYAGHQNKHRNRKNKSKKNKNKNGSAKSDKKSNKKTPKKVLNKLTKKYNSDNDSNDGMSDNENENGSGDSISELDENDNANDNKNEMDIDDNNNESNDEMNGHNNAKKKKKKLKSKKQSFVMYGIPIDNDNNNSDIDDDDEGEDGNDSNNDNKSEKESNDDNNDNSDTNVNENNENKENMSDKDVVMDDNNNNNNDNINENNENISDKIECVKDNNDSVMKDNNNNNTNNTNSINCRQVDVSNIDLNNTRYIRPSVIMDINHMNEIVGTSKLYDQQIEVANKFHQESSQNLKKAFWIIYAPPQSGKTGIINATILKFYKNVTRETWVPPENWYIFTSLSEVAVRDQLKSRVPKALQQNVYHRAQLKNKLADKLKKKKNLIIFWDEFHIAALKDQTSDKFLKRTGWNDIKILFERNIRFIEMSATPDGLMLQHLTLNEEHRSVIRMKTADGYVSPFDLIDRNQVEKYKPLTNNKNELCRIVRNIFTEYNGHPHIKHKLYHFVRVHGGAKGKKIKEDFDEIIKEEKVDFSVINFDQNSTKKDNKDINNLIKDIPKVHIIILIKEMLRASITLNHKNNCGFFYERFAGKINDSVIVQSFAGRLAGYNTPKHCKVFTSERSLKRMKELYDNDYNASVPWESATTTVRKKKTVLKKATYKNEVVKKAKPYNKRKNKPTVNGDDNTGNSNDNNLAVVIEYDEYDKKYEQYIKKCKTFEEAKDFVKDRVSYYIGKQLKGQYKKFDINNDGFYEDSLEKNPDKRVLKNTEIKNSTKYKLPKATNVRQWVCYRNIQDKKSVEFWVVFHKNQ